MNENMKFFVDTNIFFYLMIKDKDNTPIAERTIKYALEKGDVYTSTHVLFEFKRTLEYRARRAPEMKEEFTKAFEGLINFIELAEIKVLSVDYNDIKNAMKINIKELNFGDKLCIAIMEREGIKYILSADKAYDKAKNVIRIWLNKS